MLTRFSKPTCPKCGYKGRPGVEGEMPGLVSGLAEFVPIAREIAMVHDAANATLHCAQCGEPLTESLVEKTKNLKDSVGEKVTNLKESIQEVKSGIEKAKTFKDSLGDKVVRFKESIQEARTGNAFCTSCGRPLAPGARFCGGCGTAQP